MIVCHCNHIDHVAIEKATDDLLAVDPWRLLTPGSVYRALGMRPRCGGCLPLATSLIHARCPSGGECRTCPLAHMAVAQDDDVGFNGVMVAAE